MVRSCTTVVQHESCILIIGRLFLTHEPHLHGCASGLEFANIFIQMIYATYLTLLSTTNSDAILGVVNVSGIKFACIIFQKSGMTCL